MKYDFLRTLCSFVALAMPAFIFASNPQVRQSSELGNNTDEVSYFSFSVFSATQKSAECKVLFSSDPPASNEVNWFTKSPSTQTSGMIGCGFEGIDDQLLFVKEVSLHEKNTIPVFVSFPTSGEYTLQIGITQNIHFGSCLFIEDLITGETLPIVHQEKMKFTIENPYAENRFVIHTSPAAKMQVSHETCFDAKNGALDLDIQVGNWNLVLENEHGIVMSGKNYFNFTNLTAGEYSLYATADNPQCQSDVVEFEINRPDREVFELLNKEVDQCGVTHQGAFEFSFNAPAFFEYEIKASDETVIASAIATNPIVSVHDLAGDEYKIHINSSCTSKEFTVDIHDPNEIVASIFDDEILVNLLQGESQVVAIEHASTGAEDFYWSLDNGYQTNEETFIYQFTETGVHTLMLVASNEICSVADFIKINVSETARALDIVTAPYVSFTRKDDEVDFMFNQVSDANAKTFLYDNSGKEVWSETSRANNGSTITADMSTLPAGTYTAMVFVNDLPLLTRELMK